jgi:hypothetical protein
MGRSHCDLWSNARPGLTLIHTRNEFYDTAIVKWGYIQKLLDSLQRGLRVLTMPGSTTAESMTRLLRCHSLMLTLRV